MTHTLRKSPSIRTALHGGLRAGAFACMGNASSAVALPSPHSMRSGVVATS
jgi:hypothetical protein